MGSAEVLARIRSSIIGSEAELATPYGRRRITYADYTASGRSSALIEDVLRREVLPWYANTHTESSGSGLQTTRFREDAREIIRSCLGANRHEHAVIFAGSGSTAAIDRLVAILGLRVPAALDDRYHLVDHIPEAERPVVLVGPYEHHSNLLPWRESIATVIEIRADCHGRIDQDDLEARLVDQAGRPLVIGSFSAASNVTGILSDVESISRQLHRHGALAFWDFAAAGPYVGIDLGSTTGRGADRDGAHLDAVFLSPHQFLGGPGTPGVLAVRRELLTNRVPSVPGGGTVSYVNDEEHAYLTEPEHREEGGTPGIVESIRAGLVFRLKREVGVDTIAEREDDHLTRAFEAWSRHPSVEILGGCGERRLSIVSFRIAAPAQLGPGRYLHHNFVVAVLNDLFGVQARGGCSCAGPYGHRLLGIDHEASHRYQALIDEGWELLKPGWVRLNFNYFVSDDEVGFLIRAVELLADQGWRLLSDYRVEARTGLWRHHRHDPAAVRSLEELDLGLHGSSPVDEVSPDAGAPPAEVFAAYLAAARAELARIRESAPTATPLPDHVEALRWFPLPSDVEPAR